MQLQVRFPGAAALATRASAAFAGKADSPAAAQCARGLVDANAAAVQRTAEGIFAVSDVVVEALHRSGPDEYLAVARPWSTTAVN